MKLYYLNFKDGELLSHGPDKIQGDGFVTKTFRGKQSYEKALAIYKPPDNSRDLIDAAIASANIVDPYLLAIKTLEAKRYLSALQRSEPIDVDEYLILIDEANSQGIEPQLLAESIMNRFTDSKLSELRRRRTKTRTQAEIEQVRSRSDS